MTTTRGAVIYSSGKGQAPRASRRLRILIVDDEHDTVLTLTTLLQQEGHEVRSLDRAKEVTRSVTDFDPDVVLLDIALPDGSGYALAEEIRRHHGSRCPMLIALTGVYNRPPHDHLSRIVGCDHFLTKPFKIDHLLKLIAPLAH